MKRSLQITLVFALAIFASACGSEQPASPPPISDNNDNAAIIRNPVADRAPGEALDTITTARFDFAETEHRFGEVKEGTVVEHSFPFTNTGKVPLVISKASSTCGCTVADYPQSPISPGEGGEIKVVFKTDHKYGRQRKPITLIANTYPAYTTLYVDGTIINE